MGSLIRRWSPAMTCQQVLSLFLMTERSRGENSTWHPFIQSLPGHYSLPHYFSSTELGYLLPHVRERAEKDRSRAQVAFAGVKQFCQHHWPSGVDWLSWEQFRWAWCTVSSRSVYLETEAAARAWLDLTHTDENNQAMCPYLDLINHSCVAQMRAGLNANTACYEIVTEDCFQAHDQVFISYGPHDNTVLFLSYGFTLPGNVHNCVFFSIEDFAELLEVFHVESWTARREVLYQNGLHRQLVCNAEGISWSLRAALSILAMDVTQLHDCWRVLDKEAGHPDLEAHVLAMARCLLGGAFERTQQFLVNSEQKAQGQAPNRHIQLALSLARDEVFVLISALEKLS